MAGTGARARDLGSRRAPTGIRGVPWTSGAAQELSRRISKPRSSPMGGGTASPSCRRAAVTLPFNAQSSGKHWILASSRIVRPAGSSNGTARFRSSWA